MAVIAVNLLALGILILAYTGIFFGFRHNP